MHETRCPTCGTRQTEADSLQGSCPHCILQLAFEAADAEPPLAAAGSPDEARDEARVSSRVGPYLLVQRLGEGGMGEVWLADQTEGVRRRVALKIIKRGMDTKEVLLRFEAERQALAMMDHPYVAKVFDAGSTPQGRPYFAMEHVPGAPITDHCDRHRLTTSERLELFMQVCEGVQHAHHKAIIHRDLKPSNVLVCLVDGKPVPKVIDFGVAKATSHRLTERTLFTELGALIGTPEYMSPEQMAMSPIEVDTRTDVYSLGVLLYELVVGALPFESEELRSGGLDGIRRTLREREPRKPSARLSTLAGARSAEAVEVARNRRAEVAVLRRQLAGDLDWITMKALEKDRGRRYGSPANLAEDIRRHLSHEPVEASPPSLAYRSRKLVRRHPWETALGVTIALGLMAFVVTMAVQTARVSREARTKTRVTEFLTDLFKISNPSEARGRSVTARELLDKGAGKIRGALGDEPEVQAELMATMGTVYVGLGLYAEGEPLQRQALETRRRLLGPDHPDTLTSMDDVAETLYFAGRHADAATLHRETLASRKRVLGPGHRDTLLSMSNLGLALAGLGQYEEAEALYKDALEARRRLDGPEHLNTLALMSNLASTYYHRDRYAEAEAQYRETLEIQKRVLGPDHPHVLTTMNNLALACSFQGRNAEALALQQETLEIKRRVLGPEHPDTLVSMNNVGLAYSNDGRYAEAEALYRETIDIRKRVLGAEHPDTLTTMNNVAIVLTRQGRFPEAEALHREVLDLRTRLLGPAHPATIATVYNLGGVAAARGDRAEALEFIREAVGRGYARPDWMIKDLSLVRLREDPEFQKLVAAAKANQASATQAPK
jgi:serine/threonine protein kinase/tetratricopeptide (TPR) repeat protein